MELAHRPVGRERPCDSPRAPAGSSSAPIRDLLTEGARIADSLAAASDLAAARSSFGELSRIFLLLASSDPRIVEGWHVFECPMTDTYKKWLQPSPQLENPYMGRAMPSCGSPTDFAVETPASLAEARAHAEAAHGGDIAYYTCSMHPSVRKQSRHLPDLLDESRAGDPGGGRHRSGDPDDAERRQQIGVTTARVERRPLIVEIRSVGQGGGG